MIKKLLFCSVMALSIFAVGFSQYSEAASISPASQTIYGSGATARWNLSWSGYPPFKVYFRTDTTNVYKLINASSYSNSMSHSALYQSSSPYVSYTPGLLVEDSRGYSSVASAKVYKYLAQ
ncbi:hypothetical protein [Bacillus canaveralius]|uniref:hypothetical protein n=1 Tax=Bacillus canaveralius TaxID=1403243 RepID=UPI000F7A0492|nr:hypothetical protein [Bacillus canaveralius]RSK56027.1 hypothetical protein EJA13_02925 [Bacillus canaveralius]